MGRVRSRTLTTASNQLRPLIPSGVTWGGYYVNGVEYPANNMVYDGGWIGISTIYTADRPAPISSGDPYLIYDDVLPQFDVTAKVVIFGMRYTSAAEGRYIISYLVDMALGNRYIAYLVQDPLGSPIFTQLSNIVALQSGWVERAVNNVIIQEGDTFDIVVVTDEPDPTPVTFSSDWDYSTPQNPSAPSAGDIVHARSVPQTLSVNYIDAGAVDRTAILQALLTGDIIEGAGLSWVIQGSTDQGTYIDFGVLPSVTGSPTGVQEFTVQTVASTPIEYGKDLDRWLGDPEVKGLFIADGAYEDIVPDDSQYGVDIRIQEIIVSPDWDLIAQPSGGIGGGAAVFNLQESMPTGLVDGGEINNGTLANDVEITSGVGVIIDAYTNPTGTPTSQILSWPLINQAIVVTPTAGAIAFYTMADGGVAGPITGTNLGVLTEYAVRPSPTINKQEIFLGVMLHNGDDWDDISSPTVVNVTAHALEDYLNGVAGPTFIINGGEVTEASSHQLDMAAGVVWEMNRNWHVDKSNPNQESFPQELAFDWKYTNRDFSDVGSLVSTVDVLQYDNAGTVQAIGGASQNTTIQRVYKDFADNIWILWGQNIYDNYNEAVAQIGVDSANTIVPPLLQFSNLLGYIVSERTQTDWLDENSRFVSVIQTQGGGGGGVGEAPVDDNSYARNNNGWVSGGVFTDDVGMAAANPLSLDANLHVVQFGTDNAATKFPVNINYSYEPASPTANKIPISIFNFAQYDSTATPAGTSFLRGIDSNCFIQDSGVMDIHNIQSVSSNAGSGTVGTVIDFYAGNATNTGGGAITNYRAFFVEAQTGATNPYSFYGTAGAGKAYFGDEVGIGVVNPIVPLDIVGSVQTTGNYIASSAGNGLFSNTADGSDNKYISVGGGGSASSSRGAYVQAFGNEFAAIPSFAGNFIFEAGNVGTGHIRFFAGGAERVQIGNAGGMTVGSATGGNKGGGTINVSSNIYKNNSAYVNPDFVLELWITGKIEVFKDNLRAKDYKMLSLKDTKSFIEDHLRLPRISDDPTGIFDMADIALEKVEELFIHAITADEKIDELEKRISRLEGLLNA